MCNSPKGDEQCHSIFIDSKGHPYAYSGDEKMIFTFSGKLIAYIADDSTYSFSGKNLGFFEGGQIWDHSGSVILFTDSSSGGPLPSHPRQPPQLNIEPS